MVFLSHVPFDWVPGCCKKIKVFWDPVTPMKLKQLMPQPRLLYLIEGLPSETVSAPTVLDPLMVAVDLSQGGR